MAHVDGACGAAKYTDGVKESRKSKNPLRFRQSSREDCLQHDAADESDESKRLPDAGEQLGAVEVLGRPRAAVLRIQRSSKGSTGKADGEQETRIKFAQQQKCSDKRERNKWHSTPYDRRSNLFCFKTADGQRLRHQNDGRAKSEAEAEEQGSQQHGVPLQQIRQRHQWIRTAQPPNQRAQQKERPAGEQSVEYSGAPPVEPFPLFAGE